jgi:tetratricopeptide (TPR) repeat protein
MKEGKMIKYLQSLPIIYFVYGVIILISVIFFVWLIRYFRIHGISFNFGLLKADLERKDATSGSPIQFVTLDQLREGLKRGGQVNWIDRKAASIGNLRTYGRIVITGRMKLGKTREAIELLRRAESEDLIDSDSIIKPSPIFSFITDTNLLKAAGINPEKKTLLFLDDLPFHFSGENLERLSGLLVNLRICKDIFIIATARTDQLSEEHEKWLKDHKFFNIQLPDLDKEQTGRITDSATGVFGLQIEDDARQAMIDSGDGTPELIIMEMRRFSAEKLTNINVEIAKEIVKMTIVEAWADAKRYIEFQRPLTEYIFESLAAFYSTKVPPRTYFVLQFANHLWHERKNQTRSLRGFARLEKELGYLENFDIINQDDILSHPDFVAEGTIGSYEAIEKLSNFLLSYNKIYRNAPLKFLYRNARIHALELVYLGGFANDIDHNDLSIKLYDAALQLHSFSVIYNNRGIVYNDLKNSVAALADYNRAIQLDSENPTFYSNRAFTYRELDNYEAALADYNKAIELDSNTADYHSGRAITYLFLRKYETALVDIDKAIELDPNKVPYYYNRGLIHKDLKNFEAALADYNKAIELAPNEADYYNGRGNAYRNLNNDEAALADYNKAIELAPNDGAYYAGRAIAYRNLNNDEAALVDYNKAIELEPNMDGFYNGRAIIYRNLENYEAALANYNKAIELDPNTADYYYGRAITYRNLENYEAALADYNKAIELAPNTADYYYGRAITYGELKNFEAALVDCNKAIELDPNDGAYYAGRAIAYRNLNNDEAALADYNKAIELDPDDADYYNSRGVIYRNLENYDAALVDYNQSIKMEPQKATILYRIACIYAIQQVIVEACSWLNRAIVLDPEYKNLARSNKDFDLIRESAEFQLIIGSS